MRTDKKAARRRPLGLLEGGLPLLRVHGRLRSAVLSHGCCGRCRGLLVLRLEVIVVPQVTVELACNLSRVRTGSPPAAFKEEHRHQAALRRIGEGCKPAKVGAIVRAGSGLAEDR